MYEDLTQKERLERVVELLAKGVIRLIKENSEKQKKLKKEKKTQLEEADKSF